MSKETVFQRNSFTDVRLFSAAAVILSLSLERNGRERQQTHSRIVYYYESTERYGHAKKERLNRENVAEYHDKRGARTKKRYFERTDE